MLPPDCPDWYYEKYPRRKMILTTQVSDALYNLRLGNIDNFKVVSDSRPIHKIFFIDLVPDGYEYYAGHYRGENFRCLRDASVYIPSDPYVGANANQVFGKMQQLSQSVTNAISALDNANVLSPKKKRLYAVLLACEFFVLFLEIHPYINGNGHVGRFLVWAILGRYGFYLKKWTIEPKPKDPPYSNSIFRYRRCFKNPLIEQILKDIIS